MLRLAVLVSGGGTNLQAILDAIDEGTITNAEVSVVISNNAGAYALERAKKKEIDAVCLSPKTFASREAFNEALLAKLQSYNVDLVVLAGCLVVIPQSIVDAYPNKIINIHPSLIPSFCGTGYYGLKVHEGVLSRGVKVTGARFILWTAEQTPARLFCRRQSKCTRAIHRRHCSSASWKRPSGSSCRVRLI